MRQVVFDSKGTHVLSTGTQEPTMKCAGVCSNLPTSRSEGSMNHYPKLPFIFHPRLLLRHLRHQLCKVHRSGLYQRPNQRPGLWNERPVSSFLHPQPQWELARRSCVLWLHPPHKFRRMAHPPTPHTPLLRYLCHHLLVQFPRRKRSHFQRHSQVA